MGKPAGALPLVEELGVGVTYSPEAGGHDTVHAEPPLKVEDHRMPRSGSAVAVTACVCLVVLTSCMGPGEKGPPSHRALPPIQVTLPQPSGMPKNNMLCIVNY